MKKAKLKANRRIRRKLQRIFQNNLGVTAKVRWEVVKGEHSDN